MSTNTGLTFRPKIKMFRDGLNMLLELTESVTVEVFIQIIQTKKIAFQF